MSHNGLILEKENGIATITLNRPEQLNAFSIPMIYALGDAIKDIGKDTDVKVLVLTGTGRGFCAGLDLGALPEVGRMSQEELGDLLYQVIFHTQIASENNEFTIDDVVKGLIAKLIRRHPHVFGDTKVASVDDIIQNWEKIKKKEK